jgi:ethanolamine utilization microcompartment shell protein EutL
LTQVKYSSCSSARVAVVEHWNPTSETSFQSYWMQAGLALQAASSVARTV